MNKLYLHNTLTRKKEEFKPIKNKEVGILLGGISVEEMRFFNKICANQYYGISCEVG